MRNNDNNIALGLRTDLGLVFYLPDPYLFCLPRFESVHCFIALEPFSPAAKTEETSHNRRRPSLTVSNRIVALATAGHASALTLFFPFVHTGKEQLSLLIDIANA